VYVYSLLDRNVRIVVVLRVALVVLVVFSMMATVSAQPPSVTHWTIPFTGSIDVRLHAQTPTPLRGTTFSIFVIGNIPYKALYENKLNVTINRQNFVVYQTDQCCYEGINILSNLNITASMVFHVSTTVPWNGSFVFGAMIEIPPF